MLRIRSQQLEVFQPVTEAAFEERVMEYLREEHPDAVVPISSGAPTLLADVPDETLLEMVQVALKRARDYGMTWESTLTAFVVLTFVVAPHFDEYPAIHQILTDSTIDPDARIDQLWERTTEENWAAAAQSYDPDVQEVSPALDEAAIIQRIEDAWWISRDDVAREIVAELSLEEIRSLSATTIQRLEQELTTGYFSEADREAIQRIKIANNVEVNT